MANEITVSAQLQVANGKLKTSRRLNSQRFDQNSLGLSSKVQTIDTSSGGEPLAIGGGVATAGYAFLRNLDDSNFVELGVQDSGGNFLAMVKLKPGEFGVMRLATTSIHALADTAALDLEFIVLAD